MIRPEEKSEKEWLLLMKEAKKIGLHIDEVRKFITNNSHIHSTDLKAKTERN
ncbi:MAG: anti-repressor SinI family protein [Bacilli bacterium]